MGTKADSEWPIADGEWQRANRGEARRRLFGVSVFIIFHFFGFRVAGRGRTSGVLWGKVRVLEFNGCLGLGN